MASSSEALPLGVTIESLSIHGTPGITLGPEKAPDFTQLIDLANERVGGEALLCSDDFFASVDNLVKRAPAEWKAGVMTERGKWMDGWETRRHNKSGVDWAIIKLGLQGFVRGIVVDTSHFSGNHAPAIQVLGACQYSSASLPELTDPALCEWIELVPRSRCRGCFLNYFEVNTTTATPITHIKLNMFPDGGIARLRVYGDVAPNFSRIQNEILDLAAVDNGGLVVSCSDSHFSSVNNMIHRGVGIGMTDGWETKRSRVLDHNEWAVVRLGHWGYVHQVELDTKHFKGNSPDFFTLEGIFDSTLASCSYKELNTIDWRKQEWKMVIDKSPLNPHQRHYFFGDLILTHGPFTHVKLTIYPDGGVSRLRIYGFIKDPATFVKEQDMPILLCQAAAAGDISELNRLVHICKANVNSLDSVDRRSALHAAATAGSLKVVQWLVANGANLTLQDRWGKTAEDDAKKGEFTKIVEFLSSKPDPIALRELLGLRKASSVRL